MSGYGDPVEAKVADSSAAQMETSDRPVFGPLKLNFSEVVSTPNELVCTRAPKDQVLVSVMACKDLIFFLNDFVSGLELSTLVGAQAVG